MIIKVNCMNIENQIIEGLMLSDMSSPKRKNRDGNSWLTLTSIHLEFVEHLQKVLPSHSFKIYTRKARVTYDKNLKKIFNHKESYYFSSNVKPEYTLVREKWYKEGKKIIPKDIILSPISLKYFFYGDGCCSKYGKDSWQISLSTNNFTKEECLFLQELIKNKYNLNFTISKSSSHKEQHTLKLQRQKDVKEFFNIIGTSIECFTYKWKLPEIDITKENRSWKKVIHKNTGTIFGSISKAEIAYNIHPGTLGNQLRKNIKSDFNYV